LCRKKSQQIYIRITCSDITIPDFENRPHFMNNQIELNLTCKFLYQLQTEFLKIPKTYKNYNVDKIMTKSTEKYYTYHNNDSI